MPDEPTQDRRDAGPSCSRCSSPGCCSWRSRDRASRAATASSRQRQRREHGHERRARRGPVAVRPGRHPPRPPLPPRRQPARGRSSRPRRLRPSDDGAGRRAPRRRRRGARDGRGRGDPRRRRRLRHRGAAAAPPSDPPRRRAPRRRRRAAEAAPARPRRTPSIVGQVYRRAIASVVLIRAGGGEGSGFVVDGSRPDRHERPRRRRLDARARPVRRGHADDPGPRRRPRPLVGPRARARPAAARARRPRAARAGRLRGASASATSPSRSATRSASSGRSRPA